MKNSRDQINIDRYRSPPLGVSVLESFNTPITLLVNSQHGMYTTVSTACGRPFVAEAAFFLLYSVVWLGADCYHAMNSSRASGLTTESPGKTGPVLPEFRHPNPIGSQ